MVEDNFSLGSEQVVTLDISVPDVLEFEEFDERGFRMMLKVVGGACGC